MDRSEATRSVPSLPRSGSATDLGVFSKAIGDIRSLTSCGICTRPMYEPYVTSCGHCFCYSCLARCLDENRYRKTCPGCRARLTQQPSLDYTIKNIVEVLISHPAFIDKGDTVQQLRQQQRDEASLVETDRSARALSGGTLFKGFSERSTRISIFDASDGVYRCPSCNWELEGGYCSQCDVTFDVDSDDAALSLTDDEDLTSEDDEHLARLLVEQTGMRDRGIGHPNPSYAVSHTPPYARLADNNPPSIEFHTRLRRGRVARTGGESTSSTDGLGSATMWSDSESGSESQESEDTSRFVPRTPITWENHPNFARQGSDQETLSEYDPDVDDFINDGSIDSDSTGMERGPENDLVEDVLSNHSSQDFSDFTPEPSNGLGRGITQPAADPSEPNVEYHEQTANQEIPKPDDERDEASSESISFQPRQTRKRRRRVVVDDTEDDEDDDDDDVPINRVSRPRRKIRTAVVEPFY